MVLVSLYVPGIGHMRIYDNCIVNGSKKLISAVSQYCTTAYRSRLLKVSRKVFVKIPLLAVSMLPHYYAVGHGQCEF
jgi:hypothetical protein